MNDQARQLRQLMIEDALQRSEREESCVTRVRFCSGRAGVGTTTVAVNVAMALARTGARVVLVSGPDQRSSFAPELFERIGGEESSPLDGTLFVGPFGLNLFQPTGTKLQSALLAQIADFILIDPGPGPSDRYQGEEVAVYITTTDNAAVLDTYALMKSQDHARHGFVVANRVHSEQEAWEVLKRFCDVGGDYSGRSLTAAAVIPVNDSNPPMRDARPPVLQSPTSEQARRYEMVAERLAELRLARDASIDPAAETPSERDLSVDEVETHDGI